MAKKTSTRKPRTPKAPTAPAPIDTGSLQIVDRPANLKGIEDMVWVASDSLKGHEHPLNWKDHNARQKRNLVETMNQVGWAGVLLFNMNTGRLLDGHGRLDDDVRRNLKDNQVYPVVRGHWTEAEERLILQTLDPLAAMASTNAEALRKLNSIIEQDQKEVVDQLSAQSLEAFENIKTDLNLAAEMAEQDPSFSSFLPEAAPMVHAAEEKHKESLGLTTLDDKTEDYLDGGVTVKSFGEISRSDWEGLDVCDIPMLHPSRIAKVPDGECQVWVGPETPTNDWYWFIYGCAAIEKVRTSNMVVAFYTYDKKFESVWNKPMGITARMIKLGIHAVVTPNFSCYEGDWLALDMWQTFRSRWLGRYWQELGLNIIPDMMLGNLYDKSEAWKWRLAGIPKNCPCLSFQFQQKGDADPKKLYARSRSRLLKVLEKIEPQSIIAYHGPDLPENFFNGINIPIARIPTWMQERSKVMKQKDYSLGNQGSEE